MSLLSFGFSRKKRGAEDIPGGDAQDDTINKIFNWNVIEVSYVVLYYNLLLFYFIEMTNINKSNGRL